MPGTRAGRLLTDAVEALARGERARAESALEELDGPAARDLTETGAALVKELRAETELFRG